ncbi:MAG: ATP-binding protein [Lentisphaerae bacterium]|nr:ATP-binding protein [Lentisphaerota bacterium]
MIQRNLKPLSGSFFLFGPRGTGKSYWLKNTYAENMAYIDLLAAQTFNRLSADPQRLNEYLPAKLDGPVVIDEIEKVPALLDEVHRLIEQHSKRQFILTGSSPRKLRRASSNLLGGRAVTRHFYPLTAMELGRGFDLITALKYGLLPTIYDKEKQIDPQDYLAGYIETYLREEVLQEGLTRNLGAFSRFLEAASFSQGEVLNVAQVARECSVHRKVVESYFQILDELMIGYRIPVFTKKAKRKLISHSKFYFFDVGVYRAIRPHGPLDTPELIDGAALETLVLQNLQAFIGNHGLNYSIYYWRTTAGNEVDFVLYGDEGLVAIEIKRSRSVSSRDVSSLKSFREDYASARTLLLYGGTEHLQMGTVEVLPLAYALTHLDELMEHRT